METSPCVTVNVCNYPQTMIKHNDKDITYTITVELVDSDGNAVTGEEAAKYSVEFGGENKTFEGNSKIVFSSLVLKSDDFNKHEFVLTFDKSQLTKSNIYMKVTAAPTDQAELKPLSAKLGVIYIMITHQQHGQAHSLTMLPRLKILTASTTACQAVARVLSP